MRSHFRIFFFSAMLTVATSARSQTPAYQNLTLSPELRAHDLVSRLTLDEKAEQMLNTTPGIARLGIPAYDYWSEGLHGVARSGYATLFPQAIGMAATWDAPLLGSVGEVVSTEARAKYNEAVRNDVHSIYFGLTIWSPNINIFRDPRWGRGQETYGEDPFLTSTLGLNFIQGLQGSDPSHPRVIATPKHFAVHSGPESTRHSADVDPSPHDLWETYLPQFRKAIVDGHADSIMCAYNAVEGKPACASDLLLSAILRGDWKFGGFVTSDCGAVDDFFEKGAHGYSPDAAHAAAKAVLAGTDTNCGGTYAVLPAAVKQGLLREADLDRSLERLFVARIKLGLFDPPSSVPFAQIPFGQDRSREHLALSLRTAEESMVLLKNDGILPLTPSKYRTVAVVGPNAASLSALEGNYNAVAEDPKMPVDALQKVFRGARVIYSQGAPYADGVALPVPRTMFRLTADKSETGLKGEYFVGKRDNVGASFEGRPVTSRIDSEIDFDWNSAAPVKGVSQDGFAVRWSGFIVPPAVGEFEFDMRLAHCYPCGDIEHFAVKVDGKEVTTFTHPATASRESTTPRFQVRFTDTKPHAFEVEYVHQAPLFGGGITLEWVPPAGVLQAQAVAAAKESDLVIAMVGLSPELEGEEMKIHVKGFSGGDRTDVELPASQAKLLDDVAATGKPVIVVLLNGSALAVNDAQEHANAILEAWYPGEFGGQAIADTLVGASNPGGRLPVTFYRSVADLPSFDDYSMKNRTYRYFAGTPLYGFGFGLSYTRFEYSNMKLSKAKISAGEALRAEVTVRNTGQMSGDEVAELYLVPPANGNGGLSPKRQLEGYQRVSLRAGESRLLFFDLTPRELSEVDGAGDRAVQAGNYSIAIGGSQPDDPRATAAPAKAPFAIVGNEPLSK